MVCVVLASTRRRWPRARPLFLVAWLALAVVGGLVHRLTPIPTLATAIGRLPHLRFPMAMFDQMPRNITVVRVADSAGAFGTPIAARIGTASLGYEDARVLMNYHSRPGWLSWLCRTGQLAQGVVVQLVHHEVSASNGRILGTSHYACVHSRMEERSSDGQPIVF